MQKFRFDREGPAQPNGSIPVFSDLELWAIIGWH
jgi:hypothetical protein